jgi:uncharacterized circularly permuted ATP-grasp superfamily protein
MSTELLPAPLATSLAGSRPRAFHEMRHGESLNPAYGGVDAWLKTISADELERCSREASKRFHRRGITFAVYNDQRGGERLIPYDLIPRVLTADEWATVSAGCIQRVKALNAFLADIYGKQEILKAGVIPREAVLENAMWCPQAVGVPQPLGIHSHISGVDVVRTSADQWYVLEDNLRCPSGVSYMLENRQATMRLFPQLLRGDAVEPVEHYPLSLIHI